MRASARALARTRTHAHTRAQHTHGREAARDLTLANAPWIDGRCGGAQSHLETRPGTRRRRGGGAERATAKRLGSLWQMQVIAGPNGVRTIVSGAARAHSEYRGASANGDEAGVGGRVREGEWMDVGARADERDWWLGGEKAAVRMAVGGVPGSLTYDPEGLARYFWHTLFFKLRPAQRARGGRSSRCISVAMGSAWGRGAVANRRPPMPRHRACGPESPPDPAGLGAPRRPSCESRFAGPASRCCPRPDARPRLHARRRPGPGTPPGSAAASCTPGGSADLLAVLPPRRGKPVGGRARGAHIICVPRNSRRFNQTQLPLPCPSPGHPRPPVAAVVPHPGPDVRRDASHCVAPQSGTFRGWRLDEAIRRA